MPSSRHSAALVAAVVLALAAPASAVEMRVGGLPTVYSGYLVRAYGECTAPNDVARDGIPACSPVVTATCPWHDTHRFEVTQPTMVDLPTGRLFIDRSDHYTTPPECRSVFYQAVTRASGDFDDPDTLPCPSGHCTFQDWPSRDNFAGGLLDLTNLPPLVPPQFTQPLNPNREIVSVRAGIDDQTLATTGLEPAIGSAWTYDDPGGVLGGLTRARIKRKGGPGKTKGYQFDVRAAGVDFSALDFPSVTVTIAVDDAYTLLPAEAHGHRTCVVKGPKSICK